MVKRKRKTAVEQLGTLQDMVFGGATVVKSTDVLRNAGNIHALPGDIEGLTGVGIGSAFGKAAFNLALKPIGLKKRKRKGR